MRRGILYFILLFGLNITICYAEEIRISSIEPKSGSRGDEITISGNGFNIDEEGKKVQHPSAYVRFFYEYKNLKNETVKIVGWRAEINKWQDNNIIAKVPFDAKEGIVYIEVHNGIESTRPKEFWIKGTDLVEVAKMLKKSGMSNSSIVDHLFHQGRQHPDASRKAKEVFGNISLTADEIYELKQSGFQDDFIAKFEGHPQYVTLGVAPVWLVRTADLVFAPIVRVFLTPRSYFYEYRPFFGSWSKSNWVGFLQLDRWDLNFGYTTKTSTTESNDIGEEKSYALVGFSNQLNRSALFNIGLAFVPGDIEGVETQLYIGFTVDYNLLKGIGIVSK